MIVDEYYRVAIFGSARIKEDDKIFKNVFAIAKRLAENGFDVINGGGPGLMLAANSGHKSAKSGNHSLGLNIRQPFEQIANPYLEVKEEFDRFSLAEYKFSKFQITCHYVESSVFPG